MPLLEHYDLDQRGEDYLVCRCAQVGSVADFGSLLEFTLWSLLYIDNESDSRAWLDVLAVVACRPMNDTEAHLLALEFVSNRRSRLPEYVLNWHGDSRFMMIYTGWVDIKNIYCNLRTSIVGRSGDRFIAFHSRSSI